MKNMRKVNKLTIVLVLAVILIAAMPVVALAVPEVDLIPDLPVSCEIGAGIGAIIGRFFPRLGSLIQSIGCIVL